MADQKDGASAADAGLSVFNTLWGYTESSESGRAFLAYSMLLILLLVGIWMASAALTKLLDAAIKAIEAYTASGLPILMSREKRIAVRRRAQFCGGLEGDLANITKAEAWNDQFFTDLEAEVETEGGYFPTPIHRWLNKPARGLRQEKSLIRAITSSTERAIQLTGEPGSGKSVALRHLAKQLAVRAQKSKSRGALVPLYINLREINVEPNTPVTADLIREFIFDNIRRGDSDTTAFVRENWADYRDRGIWFFLFDSFDEIPAVLHAEKDNPATKEYAEAIRKFVEGMGGCRGILASREFKGPESLPWSKFRIIKLTSSKQQELVKNAFLTREQERTVLQHLASNASSLVNTPLFLTLLCRYVKDEKVAPKNDYELLSLQIDRLSKRDRQYLQKTYGLTPRQLVDGSERIARLFAEDTNIGLSPTLDQVKAVLPSQEVPGGDVDQFVAAMVDAKIARSDVANAAPGDRRFAFSHRRYQEALFVRHLVRNPGYLTGLELLTDPRWREYAVTLLETQPAAALQSMLDAAVLLLNGASKDQQRLPALSPLEQMCGFFDWIGDAPAALKLLQEGLGRRIELIPHSLSESASRYLRPRWEEGDGFDRGWVIRVGALLPQAVLHYYLEETFNQGSEWAQAEAFRQTTSLIGGASTELRKAILGRLSTEILGAKNQSALFRLEALAARLPENLGAHQVLQRCELLWKLARVVGRVSNVVIPAALMRKTKNLTAPTTASANAATASTRGALLFGAMVSINIPLSLCAILLDNERNAALAAGRPVSSVITLEDAATWATGASTLTTVMVVIAMLASIIYLIFPLLYVFRAEGERLTPAFFLKQLKHLPSPREFVVPLLMVALMMSVFLGVTYGLGHAITYVTQRLLKLTIELPELGVGFFAICSVGILSLMYSIVHLKRRKAISRREFATAYLQTGGAGFTALLQCKTSRQLEEWISHWADSVETGAELEAEFPLEMRSTSAWIQAMQRGEEPVGSLARAKSTPIEQAILRGCLNGVERLQMAIAARVIQVLEQSGQPFISNR